MFLSLKIFFSLKCLALLKLTLFCSGDIVFYVRFSNANPVYFKIMRSKICHYNKLTMQLCRKRNMIEQRRLEKQAEVRLRRVL